VFHDPRTPETNYGSIENYISEGMGIDAGGQQALRDLYLLPVMD